MLKLQHLSKNVKIARRLQFNLCIKRFCFKDQDAKEKYGNENCHTTKPKFSDKEQQRLDAIKERQKELKCK